MNKWECDAPGCDSVAIGAGGAVGLRAIGWHFQIGGALRCPCHRPDPMPCTETGSHEGKPCERCAANREAATIQKTLLTDADRSRVESLRATDAILVQQWCRHR